MRRSLSCSGIFLLRLIGSLFFITAFAACDYGPFDAQTVSSPSSTALLPDDDFYQSGDQWYLDAIDAPGAWGLYRELLADPIVGRDIVSVVTAVIDSGVTAAHPDLIRILTADGVDVTDDTVVLNPSGVPADTIGIAHGTHVAGLVAAEGGNGDGMSGAAYNGFDRPAVLITSVRALVDRDGTLVDLTEAILYAAGAESSLGVAPDRAAGGINMSLGAASLSAAEEIFLESAVAQAAALDVVMVAAAGNGVRVGNTNVGQLDGVDWPARFDDVIAVGAIDRDGNRAVFSDFGSHIELVAPGTVDNVTGVLSTLPEGRYGLQQGTSMATPLVAAAAALLRSANPALSAGDVRAILQETARDVGTAGWDSETGYGVVDMEAALRLAIEAPYGRFDSRSIGAEGDAALLSESGLTARIEREGAWDAPWNPTGLRRLLIYMRRDAEVEAIVGSLPLVEV
ncbi:MAG: S8 family serine peptidase, partial [Spirochaetales bacterium]|nr:S8 family serine peptidase [Spirochaetales bacterium]